MDEADFPQPWDDDEPWDDQPDPAGGDGSEDLPEPCDLCGTAILDPDEELYALVPDSSAVHPTDPRYDGKRMLTACSVDHLAALVEEYRARPFLAEELWAGKVCRALDDCAEPVSLPVLARASGLSEEQATRGVAWHNERAREWQREFGDGSDPG